MAARYAVGSGTNWSSTTSWSTTDGGASGASVPVAADDVHFTALSPGNITIDTAATCLSLDCTGFTHTLTHAAAVTLTVAGTLFKLVSGMTYTLGNIATSAIAFTQSGASTVLITTGGKSLGPVTTAAGLTVSSATYQLQDNCTIAATATWTHNAGTLDTNGKTCSFGVLSSSNTNTRTITLGASTVTLQAGTGTGFAWNTPTTTGLTFTPGTSTVILTNSVAGLNPGGVTFNNLTYTGPAASSLFTIYGNFTVSGAFTVTGANGTTQRAYVLSSVVGTQRTITANGTLAISNADFADIQGAGTASWNLSAATGGSGDALGNSGITFTTATTQTWSGNTTGNWSAAANWTSRVPLPQDTVAITGLTTGTITVDMARMGKDISLVGSGGGFLTSSIALTVYGSLTLAAGTGVPPNTITFTGATSLLLAGRGAQTLTTTGMTLPGNLLITAPGGTYTLQDGVILNATKGVTHSQGTIAMNGNFISAAFFTSNSGLTRALSGTGTITLTSTGTIATFGTAGLTLANTVSWVISDTSATSKTFAGGGVTTFGAITITGGGTGAVIFGGTNTFGVFTINAPKTVTLPSGTTTTVTQFYPLASAGNVITINSSTPGTQALISCANMVTADYLSLQDSSAVGGSSFLAGSHSTNVSNNSGWTFSSATYSYTASGTVVISGTATSAVVYPHTATGTLDLTGFGYSTLLSLRNFTVPQWSFVLTDLKANQLGEITNADQCTVTLPLNRTPTASFTIPADHYLAPYLIDQNWDGLLKCYRNGILRFCGPVISTDDQWDATAQIQKIAVTAAGPMWRLGYRLLGIGASGTTPGYGYSDGTAAVPKDLGTLAMNILAFANTGNALIVPLDPSANAWTGVQAGAQPAPGVLSTGAAGVWYYKPASDAIAELSAGVNGFDYEVAPVEPPTNITWPTLGTLNIYNVLGTEKDNVVFEFGTTKANLASYGRTLDRSGLATAGYIQQPAVSNYSGMLESIDNAAEIARGRFEALIDDGGTEWDILRADIVAHNIATRKRARQILTIQPIPNSSPRVFQDYIVGDTVRCVIRLNNRQMMNAFVRIWGLSFSIDKQGNETQTIQTVPQ